MYVICLMNLFLNAAYLLPIYFSLEEVESRIMVHVIESPDACTHEVAVYPGNI